MRVRTRSDRAVLGVLTLLAVIAALAGCRAAATEPLAPTCYFWKVDTVLPAHVEGAPPNAITELRTCVVHGH